MERQKATSSELGQLVKVVAKNLDAVDVVDAVELLVLRVGAVVTATDGQQNDVLAGGLLEGEGNRDRAALSTVS